MDYRRFLEDVEGLGFIKDTDTADAAIKAILGMLASSMEEDSARLLADRLPDPLTYDRLRGHQETPLDITMDEFLGEIGAQFRLNDEQALELVDTVFRDAKESIGEDTIDEIELDMPPDVAEEFDNA